MPLIYAPPVGSNYGFPKPYRPLPGETLEQTLLRDGYPQTEIDQGGAKHCRFFGPLEELEQLSKAKYRRVSMPPDPLCEHARDPRLCADCEVERLESLLRRMLASNEIPTGWKSEIQAALSQ